MDAADLDTIYAALANALARVGEPQAPLFLATLALDLASRTADVAVVAAAISRAERLTDGEMPGPEAETAS